MALLPTHGAGNARSLARLDAWTLDLVHALVPLNHPHTPDFLTPHPPGPGRHATGWSRRSRPRRRRRSPRSSTSRSTVARCARYRAWRRRPSPLVREPFAPGEHALVEESAEAVGRFFDAALADELGPTTAVLDADIAHRADLMASHGIVAMLDSLGADLQWDGHCLSVPRPFEALVDWADAGVLFIPAPRTSGPCPTPRSARGPLLSPARGARNRRAVLLVSWTADASVQVGATP